MKNWWTAEELMNWWTAELFWSGLPQTDWLTPLNSLEHSNQPPLAVLKILLPNCSYNTVCFIMQKQDQLFQIVTFYEIHKTRSVSNCTKRNRDNFWTMRIIFEKCVFVFRNLISSPGHKNIFFSFKFSSKFISFYVQLGHESEWGVIQSRRRRLTVARVQINRPLNTRPALLVCNLELDLNLSWNLSLNFSLQVWHFLCGSHI